MPPSGAWAIFPRLFRRVCYFAGMSLLSVMIFKCIAFTVGFRTVRLVGHSADDFFEPGLLSLPITV